MVKSLQGYSASVHLGFSFWLVSYQPPRRRKPAVWAQNPEASHPHPCQVNVWDGNRPILGVRFVTSSLGILAHRNWEWEHGTYTPEDSHRTWKWWFGRWFSFLRGVFSGSMSIFWGVNAFLRRWLYTPCSSSDVRWARIPSYFVVSVPFFLRQCFGWRWVVYPNKNWRIVLVMCVVVDLFVKVLLEDVVVFFRK